MKKCPICKTTLDMFNNTQCAGCPKCGKVYTKDNDGIITILTGVKYTPKKD